MTAESPKQRRSFSVLQHRGRIECGGAAVFARGLTRALRAPTDDPNLAKALTHGLHSYPARMHPAMTRALIQLVSPGSILDPFCGSGTTLVEARFAGRKSVGVDINPLATLIARAKTWIAPRNRRDELLRCGREIGELALQAGSDARRSGPPQARRGSKRRDAALAGWFAPHVRRELEYLAGAIEEVGDEELVPILQSVLSATLYKVSQRASDTDPSKVERNIARGAPARLFMGRLDELVQGLEAVAVDRHGGHPRVICGDSRRLHKLGIGEHAFEAVVSSPPYPGTYDYVDYQRLRLTFLGIDADFRRKEIGSRSKFEGRKPDGEKKAMSEWRKAFSQALSESARAVRPGGHVVLVMGDSLAGRTPVFAEDVFRDLCPPTLETVAWARAHRPILGSTEQRAFAERGKHEHIFVFGKK